MLFKKGDIISQRFKVKEENAGSYRDKEVLRTLDWVDAYSVRNLDDNLIEDLNSSYIEHCYELKPGLKKFTKLKGLYGQ